MPLLLEPQKDAGLKEFMADYGIVPDDRLILDDNQVSRALGASVTMPLVIQYGKHRITQDFTNVVTIFPLARPLFLPKEPPKSVNSIPLAITTKTSWAKQGQDWLKNGKAELIAQKDLQGPFTLAILAEKIYRHLNPKSAVSTEISRPDRRAPRKEHQKYRNLSPQMKVTSKRLRRASHRETPNPQPNLQANNPTRDQRKNCLSGRFR